MAELDVTDLLSVSQAIAIIDAADVRPVAVSAQLPKALGLRLAEAICADRDAPPFDKSLMDGYAVRCADVAQTPVELQVIGEVAAGRHAERLVGAGQAMAIMTGAPMPPGADGVVPVEETQVAGDMVRILRAASPQRLIARRGSDVSAGAGVLKVGDTIGAAQIAVAASVGAAHVRVWPRPRVAVLATGDELIAIDAAPGPAQIRNSNSPMLVSLLSRLGCDVVDLGVVVDDKEAIRRAISDSLRRHDVLVICGGMSMGRYDHVPPVLRELDVDLRITKLRIKPGKPFVFGVLQVERPRYVFGLPGNPVSAYVCTLRLASRLLARLAGGQPQEHWRSGPLLEALPPNGPREFYQPALLDERGILPLKWNGSADIYTLARANALLVRAENEPARPAGVVARVLELPT
jgi:molybdopterin molybdotransferase